MADEDLIYPPAVTSAEAGINPGAAGALGASRGLQGLIAMRLFAQRLAQAQSNFERQQTLREQDAANDSRRLDQADTRQAKLDARVEQAQKDADQQKLLAQVTQFPGARITGTQLESMGVGKDSPLRGSQFKNLEEALGGKSLIGMSGTAGTPQQSQGEIAATPHAAVGPDTFEVKPTFTEEMKGQAQALNELKAHITEQIAQAKDETTRQHYQNMLDIANQRLQLAQDKLGAGVSGDDTTAKAIAEYRLPPPSARSLATPAGEALMSKVVTYNPAYRGEEFPARASMRKAFTSGAQSKTLNNLNTSIEHLDQIAGMADKLQNSSVLPWNAVTNYFSAATGNSAVTNFNGMKTILAGELAGAFKQTGATDAEISSVKEAINSSQSPQQLRDYITKTAIPALGAKASTFGDQYRDVMGKDSAWSPYTPSAKAVLQKYGVLQPDAAPPASEAGGAAKPSGIKSITLVTP